MTTRTVKEVVKEYDKDGKVIKETVTETTEKEEGGTLFKYPSDWSPLVHSPDDRLTPNYYISPEYACTTHKSTEVN